MFNLRWWLTTLETPPLGHRRRRAEIRGPSACALAGQEPTGHTRMALKDNEFIAARCAYQDDVRELKSPVHLVAKLPPVVHAQVN